MGWSCIWVGVVQMGFKYHLGWSYGSIWVGTWSWIVVDFGVGLMLWEGGTNLSDAGLNLSGSWQQGHSATYNTPSRI